MVKIRNCLVKLLVKQFVKKVFQGTVQLFLYTHECSEIHRPQFLKAPGEPKDVGSPSMDTYIK